MIKIYYLTMMPSCSIYYMGVNADYESNKQNVHEILNICFHCDSERDTAVFYCDFSDMKVLIVYGKNSELLFSVSERTIRHRCFSNLHGKRVIAMDDSNVYVYPNFELNEIVPNMNLRPILTVHLDKFESNYNKMENRTYYLHEKKLFIPNEPVIKDDLNIINKMLKLYDNDVISSYYIIYDEPNVFANLHEIEIYGNMLCKLR